MEFDPVVWGEVCRAAASVGVAPEEFALAEVQRGARAALAPVSIYVLRDPRTDAPRYVGRTVNPAGRMKAHRRDKDGSERAAWVAELAAEGLEPGMEVVCEVTASEADWAEQWFIEGFRGDGHDLLNRKVVFDLPSLEVRLAPPTMGWLESRALEDGCSPTHVIEKALVSYSGSVGDGGLGAAC